MPRHYIIKFISLIPHQFSSQSPNSATHLSYPGTGL